jgi:adenylate cyclase
MASLVQAVADGKPAAIGLDILFSEPDRTSLKNIKKAFVQDFGLRISIVGAPPGLYDNDGYLGHILAETHAVAGRYFYFDHTNKPEFDPVPEFHFTGKIDLLALNEATGVLGNTPDISSGVKFSGFLNSRPDRDGMLRRLPLLIRYHGAIFPHLSLATYMRSLGIDSAAIEEDRNGPVIHVGGHFIPVDKAGFALLRFNGSPSLYPSVSALDVLTGSFRKDDLRGKIVFIGSSAAALNDLHSTIFDAQAPGLKTQAAAVESIATDGFVREPSWRAGAVILACIAMGLAASGLAIFLNEPWQLFLGATATAGATVLASVSLFLTAGIFVSPHAPMLVAVVLFVVYTAAKFAIERRNAYAWYRSLANARQVTIESMAAVAETRDPETGAHIKRTQHYVKAIAQRLRDTGHYGGILTNAFVDLLFVSAPLHDIGKVGVPDHILLKAGKLTLDEFVLMKRHATYGKDILYSTARKIEGDNFLLVAGEIASTHHEKWDGTGYPLGLAGQDIPLSGRIMAVADVYDALISRRCYKPAFSHERSMELMREQRGTGFDPVVFDAFLEIEQTIKDIAERYQEEGEMILGDR